MSANDEEILRVARELRDDFEAELRARYMPGDRIDFAQVCCLMYEMLCVAVAEGKLAPDTEDPPGQPVEVRR
ncbi:MAG: hypothetical protein IT381_14140 [Deltaproteobacteria bacterium]|nr:hypothetical protein [Deltaproteobacteria bacterium]